MRIERGRNGAELLLPHASLVQVFAFTWYQGSACVEFISVYCALQCCHLRHGIVTSYWRTCLGEHCLRVSWFVRKRVLVVGLVNLFVHDISSVVRASCNVTR
jgi:hypothetical protein